MPSPHRVSLIKALALALTIGACTRPSGTADTLAFTNVNVISMADSAPLAAQTVLIRNGRIAAMGPAGRVQVPAIEMTFTFVKASAPTVGLGRIQAPMMVSARASTVIKGMRAGLSMMRKDGSREGLAAGCAVQCGRPARCCRQTWQAHWRRNGGGEW